MTIYAGLDVSDKTTHVCVVDEGGAIIWRGVCATDPEVIARAVSILTCNILPVGRQDDFACENLAAGVGDDA